MVTIIPTPGVSALRTWRAAGRRAREVAALALGERTAREGHHVLKRAERDGDAAQGLRREHGARQHERDEGHAARLLGGEVDVLWLFLEQRSQPQPDPDMQVSV